MGASITLAGESLIAQKQAAQQVLDVARFVLAYVPGLNANAPVDRAGVKPPANQIVYTADVNRKGFVSPRQVVYSLMVGSDIGDWDFNWIGLETAENVLLAVAYVPVQQKRRNIPPLQIGNNVTRNFLVEFSGAQALTGLVVDASTWQHDFTIRLNGIDERERVSNRDMFGRVCFLSTALQMERNSLGLFQLKPGVAYVEGVRVALTETTLVQLPALPAIAWLDVSLAHIGSDVVASWTVVFGAAKTDYLDSNGIKHYVVPLASIAETAVVTDQRSTRAITTELIDYFAARDGDYPHLRARATTKEDVDLDQLPNAKSDDPSTNSSEVLATTKALINLLDSINSTMTGMIGMFPLPMPPTGWLKANGDLVSRTTYAALFSRIGISFGPGDGTTTFKLPEVRGEFLRALDDNRGVDAGRVLGSPQGSQNLKHDHEATTEPAGAHKHKLSVPRDLVPQAAESNMDAVLGDEIEQGLQELETDSAPDHTHSVTVQPSGGSEARPRNIAFLACIKY